MQNTKRNLPPLDLEQNPTPAPKNPTPRRRIVTPDAPNVTRPNKLRSADLYYAAFLATVGLPLLKIDRPTPRKAYFIFNSEGHNMAELEAAWLSDTARVPPGKFSYHVKQLKAAVHHGV